MTSSAIRQSFLDFFKEKQHTIVPSSSLLPDSPNLLFTNAGMNQFVPIFLGQAPCPYSPARAADTQKCIRAGGKHNDLEDVGFDTYHHTFFEMLGNWSFGNYFKKEAIEWAWELVVNRWGFPPSRVYATIYSPGPGDPASLDREAHEHWSEIFIQNKLDPAYHVVHGNKKDNFWMMGDTGPCGPCSELHIDLTPGPRDLDIPRQIAGRNLVNQGDARCIEIWNLVFIQFNANPDGTFIDLPAKHVDTGMGFERVTSMIQGTKGFTDFENAKISNYETDVFRPIFDELEKITGKKYTSTLPASAQNLSEDEKVDVAFRVIADHIRTLSFSIVDGIQPSNEGRGYVLRRILRRAVSYSFDLNQREPFLFKLVATLADEFGSVFPAIRSKQNIVEEVIRREEEMFGTSLAEGLTKFSNAIRSTRAAAESRNNALKNVRDLKTKITGLADSQSMRSVLSENDSTISAISMNVLRLSSLDTIRYVGKEGVEAQSHSKRLFYHENLKYGGDILGGELAFRSAILESVDKLEDCLDRLHVDPNVLSGRAAFLLFDTLGFPLDLTEVHARKNGMTVDVAGFERLMEEQKDRGKASQKREIISVSTSGVQSEETKFNGYEQLESDAHITTFDALEEGGKKKIFFISDRTPFYASKGGQVSDKGEATVDGVAYQVSEVQGGVPDGRTIYHFIAGYADKEVSYPQGTPILLKVDEPRRAKIEAHHSGTHLMNWALRKVLGNTITQKGSYVGPDRLRFDFSHGAAMTPAEIAEVERLVNEKISADVPVKWEERPYAEVKGDPSILQFFGDKYGDVVRVVSIGDFSKELCGGTHVRNSARVGYFKIISEGAIAAGIRRIEAVSGDALLDHVKHHLPRQQDIHTALLARKANLDPMSAFLGEETPEAFWKHFEARETFLRQAAIDVAMHEKDEAKHQVTAYQKQAAAEAADLIGESGKVGEIPLIHHIIDEYPSAYLPYLADAIRKHWSGVIVLAAIEGGKVSLLASVCPEHTKKIQAGKIIQAIAPLVGGKGGGRPELAQGGGTNPDGIPAALEKVEEMLRSA